MNLLQFFTKQCRQFDLQILILTGEIDHPLKVSAFLYCEFTIYAMLLHFVLLFNVSLRPIPEREFVENYIKAYYLGESILEQWLSEHQVIYFSL